MFFSPRYWSSMTSLAIDAQEVIWLRGAVMMTGSPTSRREGVRMITEKMIANQVAFALMATGASPEKILKHYHSRVRSNRRRLKA